MPLINSILVVNNIPLVNSDSRPLHRRNIVFSSKGFSNHSAYGFHPVRGEMFIDRNIPLDHAPFGGAD
jgi:hypothetical protein